jgi:hypothetical protein
LVAAHGDGASAGLFDGADGFRAVGDVRHHHFGTLGGQPLAEGLPNPVGPARDDCALAGRHFRHSPYWFSLVPATWLSALTVNIQKLDNFQNNSRGRANLSSAYRRAAGQGTRTSVANLGKTQERTRGWRFVRLCSNFQNMFLAAAILSDEARRGHEAFSR